jgi:hypothetical protein
MVQFASGSEMESQEESLGEVTEEELCHWQFLRIKQRSSVEAQA